MQMDFYSYWGKARPNDVSGPAYHLLAYHSLDVAAVGSVLLRRDEQMRHRLVAKTGIDESAFLSLATFFLSLHEATSIKQTSHHALLHFMSVNFGF